MPFDIEAARKAGKTDDQIADYLGQSLGFDVTAARKSGKSSTQIAEYLSTNDRPPQTENEAPGFFSSVGQDIVKRGSNIIDEITAPVVSVNPDSSAIYEATRFAPERALRVAGQTAGLANDIVGEGLKSAYNAIMPEAGKQAIGKGASWVAGTAPGKAAIEAAGAVSDAYKKFEQNSPNLSKDINSVANILMAIPSSKVAKEGVNLGEDVAKTFTPKKTAAFFDKKISSEIENGINKGVRPSVSGKARFADLTNANAKAVQAVKTIVENKSNLNLTDEAGQAVAGTLPKNLKQFSQAIDQTKQQVFNAYDELAKKSGNAMAKVNLDPIATELEGIAADKVVNLVSPGAASYAGSWAERLKGAAITPKETQQAIASLNRSLDAFYKNQTYDTASKAYIDSLVVNNMRNSLDDVIEKTAGDGYQELKKVYGSLKSIEKEVSHRAVVASRQNPKGLIDFSDIFSGSSAVHGILSLNPAMVGEAAAAKGISKLYKNMNDPNKIIKAMFEKVDKLSQSAKSANSPFSPKSKTISYLGKIAGNERGGMLGDFNADEYAQKVWSDARKNTKLGEQRGEEWLKALAEKDAKKRAAMIEAIKVAGATGGLAATGLGVGASRK